MSPIFFLSFVQRGNVLERGERDLSEIILVLLPPIDDNREQQELLSSGEIRRLIPTQGIPGEVVHISLKMFYSA